MVQLLHNKFLIVQQSASCVIGCQIVLQRFLLKWEPSLKQF